MISTWYPCCIDSVYLLLGMLYDRLRYASHACFFELLLLVYYHLSQLHTYLWGGAMVRHEHGERDNIRLPTHQTSQSLLC